MGLNLVCPEFQSRIDNEDIIVKRDDSKVDEFNREEEITFFIHGFPHSCDDGDGIQDDMTEEIEIFFCPFCGTILKRKIVT